MQNIHRLIYRSPDIAWNTTTSHLLMIIQLPFAPQAIRIQAAKVLDEILLIVPRHLSSTGELQADVQRRVINVLAEQVVPDSMFPLYQQTSTSVELRRMGLETLHQILQGAGHTLVVGWETIFQMLGSVCRSSMSISGSFGAIQPTRHSSTDSISGPPSLAIRTKPIPLGLGNPTEKSYNGLVKIAFQLLTLVCDSVSSLSTEHLRLGIGTLGQFGRFVSPIGSFQRRRSCRAKGRTGAGVELLLNISSMGDQPFASPISALRLQALTLSSSMAVVCYKWAALLWSWPLVVHVLLAPSDPDCGHGDDHHAGGHLRAQ